MSTYIHTEGDGSHWHYQRSTAARGCIASILRCDAHGEPLTDDEGNAIGCAGIYDPDALPAAIRHWADGVELRQDIIAAARGA